MILKIRPCATAAHVYPRDGGRNVTVRCYNRTINGNHYEIEPSDPARPAFLNVELSYQFGKPGYARLEFEPASGWTIIHPSDRRERVSSCGAEDEQGWASAHISN